MLISDLLDSLCPTLAPDRARALDGLRDRAISARATLAQIADSHGNTVERAALIDLGNLKHRLVPDLLNAAGRATQTAIELLATLDRAELPIDVREGFRHAVAANTPGHFSQNLNGLSRDVARYESAATNAAKLVKALLADLKLLADAPALFAEQFPVTTN